MKKKSELYTEEKNEHFKSEKYVDNNIQIGINYDTRNVSVLTDNHHTAKYDGPNEGEVDIYINIYMYTYI
jgi:hypothetical protein